MKKCSQYVILLAILITVSCTNEKKKEVVAAKPIPVGIPFQNINLDDLDAFLTPTKNWMIAKSVYADRLKKKHLEYDEGKGVLVNIPNKTNQESLFSKMKHGDLELEFDVMMPKGSNSGIYFQSRYEVQLFDSWGESVVSSGDMGGIYQRWDTSKEEGDRGYEGSAPLINAAKSPGLWQHYKIVFIAPRFNANGEKVKNAFFESVWLNDVLVQKNVEVTGPTRAAAFTDEKPQGSLMIQGDHGPVAFKNIKYKKYSGESVSVSNLTLSVYESKSSVLTSLDSLELLQTNLVDSISAKVKTNKLRQKVLRFEGEMNIPRSGDYVFDLKLLEQGGIVLLDKDTIFNKNGIYSLDSVNLRKVNLAEGKHLFTLIYNKNRPWRDGFSLEMEGPEIKKHLVTAPQSLDLNALIPKRRIIVNVDSIPVVQRSFIMHDGIKKTHCVSVGSPEGIHYSFDLEKGALLQLWSGSFFDATQMWKGRGEKQLGEPIGFTISSHGDTELAVLQDYKENWPLTIADKSYKQVGYNIDANGFPVFESKSYGAKIFNTLIPMKKGRGLQRNIIIEGSRELWYKVADGELIELLPNGDYLINNESYFISFPDIGNLKPRIRHQQGKDELLIKIPSGKQRINYNIIW